MLKDSMYNILNNILGKYTIGKIETLLYFDETQNVNVNLLISARRLTNTTQNN